MRIGFAGTPDIAADILQQLLASNIDIKVIITKPDALVGRGKNQTPSPVSVVGTQASIPLLKPTDLNSELFIEQFKNLDLDIVIVVAYGKIIPQRLLSLTKLGWFNLHFSMLPKYRGAAPVQHALLNGETHTGVTFFKIDAGLDTGEILDQVQSAIGIEDDAIMVFQNLTQLGADLVIKCVQNLSAGTQVFSQQDQAAVAYAPKFTTAFAQIDWLEDGEMIVRKIRAMAAGPICYSFLDENRVKVLKCARSQLFQFEPGQIGRVDQRIYVGSASFAIELLTVQPSGKRSMAAVEWFNGLRMENPQFK